MKTIFTIYFVFSIIFVLYLLLPNSDFPLPPPGALQSQEPADTETPFRRAYFTDFTRGEVLSYYQSQFDSNPFLKLNIITYRLNYPPEEAQTIIRDQTRSTFLEEIVHPYRASLFVNGFEPKNPKDAIFVQDKNWRQKIIVKYVPSTGTARLFMGGVTILFGYVLLKFMQSTYHEIRRRFQHGY